MLTDGNLLFGTDKNAKTVELDDMVSRLFDLMDGHRNLSEIDEFMRNEFADVQPGDVETAVRQMVEANLVEDAELAPSSSLNSEELSRYDRQLLFFSGFEKGTPQRHDFQARLKASHVTILGCGGVGSHTFQNLACAGIGNLRVVDFDRVEDSNLNRSFLYRSSDVGKRKIEVLKDQAESINPFVAYEFHDKEIRTYADVEELIKETDFVVLCADTPYLKINEWVNEACLRSRTPYSLAGSSEEFGTVGPLTVPFQTSCFNCQGFDQTDLHSGPQFVSRANKARKAPSFVSVIATLAGLNSLEIVKYITGLAESSLLDRQLKVDFQTLDFSYVEMPRKRNCPSCSQNQ